MTDDRSVLCDCCPNETKHKRVKLAEIALVGDVIEIKQRRYGQQHVARVRLADVLKPS